MTTALSVTWLLLVRNLQSTEQHRQHGGNNSFNFAEEQEYAAL